MNRRTFLAGLAAYPILLEVLSGCSPIVERGVDDPGGGGDLVRSNHPRTAGTDPTFAATNINIFGANLLATLQASSPDANLVCSPLSVAVALSMTMAGAAGSTRDEMAKVLGYDAAGSNSADSVDEFVMKYLSSTNALLGALATRNQTKRDPTNSDEPREVQLTVANALWGQSGQTWNPEFLNVLAEQFGAGIETVDYQGNPEDASETINNWVDDKTKGRIPELIDDGMIDESTRLVLTNAVYLKADWDVAFDSEATEDEAFLTAAGKKVEVPMMYSGEDQSFAVGDGWKAVELPYVFEELSLVAVVTDDDAVAVPAISDVIDQLTYGWVQLRFPRFDFETKRELSDVLERLGMQSAFHPGADFSAMTDTAQMYISQVVHQANITTGEAGTEASAATAIEMVDGASAPGEERVPTRISFDRPFTFWLRDAATGAVLFTGRVTDPSNA